MADRMREDDRPNLKICIDNSADYSHSESSASDSDSEDSSSSGSSSSSHGSSSSSSSSGSDSSSSSSGESDDEAEAVQVSKEPEGRKEEDIEVDEGEVPAPDAAESKASRKPEKKASEFITGFDPLSEEFLAKRVERAKRFGIKDSAKDVRISSEDRKQLYHSLGVKQRDLTKGGEDGIQFQALHIRGMENMREDDILDYFKDFPSGSIEWVNSSCNLVWQDPVTAARAMLALSCSREDVESGKWNKKNPSQKTEKKMAATVKDDSQKSPQKMSEDDESDSESEHADNEEDDDELNLLSEEDEAKLKDVPVKKKKKTKKAKKEKTVKEKAATKTQEVEDMEEGECVEEEEEQKEVEHRPGRKQTQAVPAFLQSESSADLDIPWPPGMWRLGMPHPKAEYIFMRFATKSDVAHGAEKPSYQRQSNPNFGGSKGFISNSRRNRYRESPWERGTEKSSIIDTSNDLDEIPWADLLKMHAKKSGSGPRSPKQEMSPLKRIATKRKRNRSDSGSGSEHERPIYSRIQAIHRARPSDDVDAEFFKAEGLNVDKEELDKLLEPPKSKRFMRMHADDEEEERDRRRAKERMRREKASRVAEERGLERESMNERQQIQERKGRERTFLSRDFGAVDFGGRGSKSSGRDLRSRLDNRRRAPDRFSDRRLPRMTIEVEQDR